MNKLLVLLTIFFILPFTLLAQNKTIKGKVTDENGAAISGVTVVSKNAPRGTQTDKEGNFSISLSSSNAVNLVFTSVGYGSKTVPVTTETFITVQLKKEAITQEDVVVIGYQTIRRKDLLASVSSIGAKDLKDIPINSAAEALNGRLAGVTATTAEGSPDAAIRIRIRGGISITQDNSPLYIVDGIQMENALNVLSPQDIQSIDVLKDAAATAIYGARGGNGVIVITTKSGKQGKLKVLYNGFVGIKKLAKELDVLSPYDFIYYQSERSRGSGTDSTTFGKNYGTTWDTLNVYKNVPAVDWQKETYGKTGFTQTHNLSLSGGSNRFTYNIGYTFNSDKAIVINSSYKRHLANFRGDYKINSKMKIGISARLTQQEVLGAGISSENGTSYNRLRNTIKYRPFLMPNQALTDADQFSDPSAGNGLLLFNPILYANAEYRQKTTKNNNISLTYTYNILKNLSLRSTVGYVYNKFYDWQFSDSSTSIAITQGAQRPVTSLDSTFTRTYTNSNVLTYTVKGFRKKHDFSVLAGEETYQLNTTVSNRSYKLFPLFIPPVAALLNPQNGTSFTGFPRLTKSKYTNLSFFGRMSYGFKDKYLASVDVRADGASKFGPGNKWGYFPAASLAWRVKKEKFLQNVDFITDLKFRAGMGVAGNNRIPDYLYISTFSSNGTYFYGINNQAVLAYYSAGLVNPTLKWESTLNKNLGLDLAILKNRLSLSVDVYSNESKDLLLNVPIASTYGYSTQLQNVGKTRNKGIELQLNGQIVNKRDFTWSATFNISSNKNKVEQLGVNQTSFFPAASWGVSGQPTDYIIRIGDPVGSMYGLVNDGFYTTADFDYNSATGAYTLKSGVTNATGVIGVVQPGMVKFKDISGPAGKPDGVIDLTYDRQIIGNPTPKFTGGLNQQFTYKRWELSAFVNFSYGNDVYNANKVELTNAYTNNSNLLAIMANRWKIVNASGQTTQWVIGNTAYGFSPDQLNALNANATIWQPIKSAGAFYPSSWAIEDGSFLRINNISVGYNMPVNRLTRLHMSKLKFYFTANNVAIITNYSGYDPEVSVRNSPLTPGLDYSAYPKSRSYIFGINASF
ncbi:SusC/RagA family TonB-linked outer membrane protein [Ferruginibacter sp. SUN106]|uniref:SusC/RagA family TonB-linked outer membrane protein n=1 Tax=Ferruginibacter sp. SUN106 TaxID=2978348 RepID=UPI003D35CA9A